MLQITIAALKKKRINGTLQQPLVNCLNLVMLTITYSDFSLPHRFNSIPLTPVE